VPAIGFTCVDQRQPGSNTPRPTTPPPNLRISAWPLSVKDRFSSGDENFLMVMRAIGCPPVAEPVRLDAEPRCASRLS
jgi:hypothetical protein